MSKTTVWTCDRCGYVEATEDGHKPKERDFYTLSISAKQEPTGYKFPPCAEVLWCRECCQHTRLVDAENRRGDKPSTPRPTMAEIIEEMIDEKIAEAVEDATER